jgi:hypothetical protein
MKNGLALAAVIGALAGGERSQEVLVTADDGVERFARDVASGKLTKGAIDRRNPNSPTLQNPGERDFAARHGRRESVAGSHLLKRFSRFTRERRRLDLSRESLLFFLSQFCRRLPIYI